MKNQLTFWSEEHLANHSQSQASEKDSVTREETSCLSISEWLTNLSPSGLSGKMSLVSCLPMEDEDFGTFLTALGKIGYGFAYRVLDAQYFGVPQRRRRVFVVGCLGDWRSAGKVLFESESLSGNPPPSREKGERVAPTVTTGPPFSRTGNERVETEAYVTWPAEIASTLNASFGDKLGLEDQHINGGAPLFVPSSFARVGHGHYSDKNDIASTVRARDYKDATDLVTFSPQNSPSNGLSISEHTVPTLQTKKQSAIQYDMKVRRLTPKECERLQGFPDDWTRIQWKGKKPEECPDGHRYKAMGNSMAVPVMRWIGQQIKQVEEE